MDAGQPGNPLPHSPVDHGEELSDYFGPDRRRMEMDTPDGRRVGLAGHARYHFMRSPDAGIKIVKHEVFAAPIRPMLDVA